MAKVQSTTAKADVAKTLADGLRDAQAAIPELLEIAQLHVCRFVSDASTAMLNGCVLLGISTVNDDEDGDGFRLLVGLPRGVTVTPYLSNYFERTR